ncbi:hypothetical protein GCM10025864_28350 [Luteimicrobium album]|uniref:Uncharacterized protein n=1 Tax=Luteimicrobium album TaxID=1054550 RepID=A0ABQ6I2V8_9MICO|nr:hypothetical protein [Luteimicrobium album]GMA25076.1 hypothetical protein GCM10025864_28350 [Luteimicrobium album]
MTVFHEGERVTMPGETGLVAWVCVRTGPSRPLASTARTATSLVEPEAVVITACVVVTVLRTVQYRVSASDVVAPRVAALVRTWYFLAPGTAFQEYAVDAAHWTGAWLAVALTTVGAAVVYFTAPYFFPAASTRAFTAFRIVGSFW